MDGLSFAVGRPGLAALAFTWFVGLLVSFRLAVDLKPSTRLEILCVVLATIHLAAGIAVKTMPEDGLGGLVYLPAHISLIVGPLVLSGVIIGRVRRRRRRPGASDTPQ